MKILSKSLAYRCKWGLNLWEVYNNPWNLKWTQIIICLQPFFLIKNVISKRITTYINNFVLKSTFRTKCYFYDNLLIYFTIADYGFFRKIG